MLLPSQPRWPRLARHPAVAPRRLRPERPNTAHQRADSLAAFNDLPTLHSLPAILSTAIAVLIIYGEITMNETKELEVVDLGDAKEVTMGPYSRQAEDHTGLPTRLPAS